MIKCIVIDDEQLAQEILESHLEKIPDIEIVGVFNNAFDAMKVLRSNEINLVFCDIQMPDLDGVNFLGLAYLLYFYGCVYMHFSNILVYK